MRFFYLLPILLLLSFDSLIADTVIIEDIIKEEIWTKSKSPYLIKQNITISKTGSLVIEAGVVVKFQTPASSADNIRVLVEGKIQVLGQPQNRRVVFTSSKDDVFGGDTNLDGLANVPDFGDWLGFQINSDFADECIFQHCLFRYGGFSPNIYGAIQVLKGSPVIKNGYFYRCAKDIVVRGFATPLIEDNLFERTGWTPVSMSISAAPVFRGNTFKNVGLEFLGLEVGAYFLNGHYELSKKKVAGINRIPYFIQSDISIEYGMTLNLEPGVIIKFNVPPVLELNPKISVRGTLNAVGTTNEPIIFTSERDDAIGGDGNNDGNTNPARPGDWFGIEIEKSSNNSKLDFCHFRYGGYHPTQGYGAVRVIGSKLKISNCEFIYNSKGVVITNQGSPLLQNNHFEESTWVPVSMGLNTYPVFKNNSYKNNKVEAFGIESGSYRSVALLVLDKISDGGLDNMPYFIQEEIIIEKGTGLEIRPGVVMKFNTVGSDDSTVGIKVRGSIDALGNEENPIILTSERDDFYGGDTNHDGNTNLPEVGDWWGIILENQDSPSLIEHCIFRYGGYTTDAYGAVCIEEGNHEVRHCTFFQNSKGIVAKGNSFTRVVNNTFEHSGWVPVSKSFAARFFLAGNAFKNNPVNAIGLEGGAYHEAADYELDNTSLLDGQKAVYYIHEDILLGAAVNLKINPGVVIKFDVAPDLEANHSFLVQGTLQAIGTDQQPIVFTSERDDTYGGDTNNNGETNQPNFGDWLGLELNGLAANNSIIEKCIFRYGGYRKIHGARKVDYGVLRVQDANPLIRNNHFKYNYKHLVVLGNARPRISENLFESSAKVAISRSLEATPEFIDNQFENNAINALGLEAGNYNDGGSYQLGKSIFRGNQHTPFYVDGLLEISQGSVLQITPGVIFRFADQSTDEPSGGLLVREEGRLLAKGTQEEPIIFTSELDNEYGGVIHRDHTTAPSSGEWSGVEIQNSDLSQVQNCLFRYGGGGQNGVYGALNIQESVPVVENCVFEYNEKGLVVWNQEELSVKHCRYLHNKIGVSVEQGVVRFNENVFFENEDYDIENLGHHALYAKDSEWDFYNLVQVELKGDDHNLENIFDHHDDPSTGKVHLEQGEGVGYFIHKIFPQEVEEEAPEVLLTVQGLRFQQGTRVILRKEWQADIIAWVTEERAENAYEIEVNMKLDGAAPGYYDVIVINPDGRLLKLEKSFRILGFEPSLDEITELLQQNFPNPFSEETEIRFALPQEEEVKVEVLGRGGFSLILLDQKMNEGRHSVIWAGGEALASGVYYCRLTIGDHVEVKKVVYIRE